jgi:hypothetical protein
MIEGSGSGAGSGSIPLTSEPYPDPGGPKTYESDRSGSKTTKLILLDSLLQEVVVTLPHLVLQKPSTAKMCERGRRPTGIKKRWPRRPP